MISMTSTRCSLSSTASGWPESARMICRLWRNVGAFGGNAMALDFQRELVYFGIVYGR